MPLPPRRTLCPEAHGGPPHFYFTYIITLHYLLILKLRDVVDVIFPPFLKNFFASNGNGNGFGMNYDQHYKIAIELGVNRSFISARDSRYLEVFSLIPSITRC